MEDGPWAMAPQPGLMWKMLASPVLGISAGIHGSDRGLQEGKVKANKYISSFLFFVLKHSLLDQLKFLLKTKITMLVSIS